ncbi:MAG: hypothetical protein ACTTH5_08390, partial [Wolinella sp.]
IAYDLKSNITSKPCILPFCHWGGGGVVAFGVNFLYNFAYPFYWDNKYDHRSVNEISKNQFSYGRGF